MSSRWGGQNSDQSKRLCSCGDSSVVGEWQCKGPEARQSLMREKCLSGRRWGRGGEGQPIQDLIRCVKV